MLHPLRHPNLVLLDPSVGGGARALYPEVGTKVSPKYPSETRHPYPRPSHNQEEINNSDDLIICPGHPSRWHCGIFAQWASIHAIIQKLLIEWRESKNHKELINWVKVRKRLGHTCCQKSEQSLLPASFQLEWSDSLKFLSFVKHKRITKLPLNNDN